MEMEKLIPKISIYPVQRQCDSMLQNSLSMGLILARLSGVVQVYALLVLARAFGHHFIKGKTEGQGSRVVVADARGIKFSLQRDKLITFDGILE
jgi:hypothetical protein